MVYRGGAGHRRRGRNTTSSTRSTANEFSTGQGSSHRPSQSSHSDHHRPKCTSSSRSHLEPQELLPADSRSSTAVLTDPEIVRKNSAILDNDEDSLHEVIMCTDMTPRGTVGCCYYVAREEKLYFMEDIQLGGLHVVESLRLYINPTTVLLSTTVDEDVINYFDPETKVSGSVSAENDQFRLPYVLDVRPVSDFNYDAARSKLMGLDLGDENGAKVSFNVPGELAGMGANDEESLPSQQSQLLRLAGWIDIESRVTVGCAGALISLLQRRRAAVHLLGHGSTRSILPISVFEMSSLRETMFVNSDTLHSLQVIGDESHPNSHNRGPKRTSNGSKEGLSVYGLFQQLTRTSQGRHLLRQYFLRPSVNIDIINERLDTVATLLRPENEAVLAELSKYMKSIGNMNITMARLKKGSSGASLGKGGISKSLWSGIRNFAFYTLKIKETLSSLLGGDDLNISKRISERFEDYHIKQIGRKISETVDFEQSAEQFRTIILPGVDEELDQMKRTLSGLDDLLNKVAKKLSEKMPSNLQSTLHVIYFPQIGFLVTVPVDPDSQYAVYDGSFDDPWERMFSTDIQAYFKTDQMREMDDHFGDVYGIISDREIEIAHELAQFVLQHEESLIGCSNICGELDCLLALSQGARMYNLCRPEMTLDNVVQIKGGRHALQELTVPSFVPNDTVLAGGLGSDSTGDHLSFEGSVASPLCLSSSTIIRHPQVDEPSMLMLTGPNYSGKSVYLKQVALIVFMAHVGSFVPAESATIGITDKILSRVTTRETVCKTQSAFMLDLQQISLALSLATRRSLLIIDEFGKGTESSDGAGLAAAVMEHLLNLGIDRPKVLGATHFHEIFEMDMVKPRPALAFGHMEVRIDRVSQQSQEQITYLYNFRPGRSTSSFGTICAEMNGVPEELVSRAEELILVSMKGEDLVKACCQMPRDEATELEEAEQIARQFLMVDIKGNPKEILRSILGPSVLQDSCR